MPFYHRRLLVVIVTCTLVTCWGLSSTDVNLSSPTIPKGSRVAVVAGGSRGIGRGIALELGAAGYTVYALGRTSKKARRPPKGQRAVASGLDLTVESAAEQVTASGGIGHALACDLRKDASLEKALETVYEAEGRLDILVYSANSTPPNGESLRGEFWTQSMDMWDAVNGLGLRQVYAACRIAAPKMIETAKKNADEDAPPPLICLVSSFGGKSYTFNVAYGVGKAGVDRLASDMSYQLKKYGVATTSLYPGLVKTEANLHMVEEGTWDAASGGLDLSKGETPLFSGRAVVKLAALHKEAMMKKTGTVQVVAELAEELGFTDIDGTIPPSIRSLRYLLPNFVFPQIEEEAGKPVPDWMKDNVPDFKIPWSIFSSAPAPEQD